MLCVYIYIYVQTYHTHLCIDVPMCKSIHTVHAYVYVYACVYIYNRFVFISCGRSCDPADAVASGAAVLR